MHERLRELPVRVHGKGLLAGIELKDNGEVAGVVKRCLERGVQTCDTGRKWVKIGPQLNIEEEDLMEGIKVLIESVEEVVNARNATPCGDSGEKSGKSNGDISQRGVDGSVHGELESKKTNGSEGEHN